MTPRRPHTKRITLNGDILFFQCKYSDQDGDKQVKSDLICQKLSFTGETNSFSSLNGDTTIYKDSSADVDVVHCSTAFDRRKKTVVPCILLRQWKQKSSCYRYKFITLTSPTKAELHVKFSTQYELRDDISICQGPTIMWRHEGNVYYASACTGEVRSLPVQMSPVVFLGELCDKLIVFGSLTHVTEEEEAIVPQGINKRKENKIVAYSIEDGKVLDGTCIMPNAYGSVVQCTCVVSAVEVGGHLEVTMVAATNRKQLVCFENGHLKEVCQLPFEEPESIKMANTGNSGLLLLISFNHGNVCAVWKDTFQVAAQWSGMSSVLVDDFVGCGTDQVLLVLQDQNPPESLANFILTDLCGTVHSHGYSETSEEFETSDASEGNYLCTLQALESRLQSGLTLLQDLQRDLDVKDRVLLQSTNALSDMVSGRDYAVSKTEQEGLVSLWMEAGGEEEEGEPQERMQIETEPAPPPFLVDALWQRIMDERLVVGVSLTKRDDILLKSAAISLLVDAAQGYYIPAVIQTQSTAHWLHTHTHTHGSSPPEPVAKRKRLNPTEGRGCSSSSSSSGDRDLQKLTLTAVCDLAPFLTGDSVKCSVVLHYVQAEEATDEGPPTQKAFLCGVVSLSISDVTRGLYHPLLLQRPTDGSQDELRQDLLSLLALLESWSLQISSPDHTLLDVGQLLREALGCETVKSSPQYLVCNPTGASASAVMVFHWRQKSPFLGELIVYCSGTVALLRFLHSLCGFLPASCHVQPLRKVGGSEGRGGQEVARSLEKEVLALRDGLSSLLTNWQQPGGQGQGCGSAGPMAPTASGFGAPGELAAEELQRRREEWQRDIEGSNRRSGPLVAVDRYHVLVQRVLREQLQVDIDVLLDRQVRSVFIQ